jgi:hypothetical protein
MTNRQCSSCGGFCKKSGCERANVKKALNLTDLIMRNELAEQAGFGYDDLEVDQTMMMIIERFAELIRQDEREACAKFLESTDLSKAGEYTGFIANMLLEYAKAIRARGRE